MGHIPVENLIIIIVFSNEMFLKNQKRLFMTSQDILTNKFASMYFGVPPLQYGTIFHLSDGFISQIEGRKCLNLELGSSRKTVFRLYRSTGCRYLFS